MHHTRIKKKTNKLDGKSDCNVDDSNYAKTLSPDDSKSENFMKKEEKDKVEKNCGKSVNSYWHRKYL